MDAMIGPIHVWETVSWHDREDMGNLVLKAAIIRELARADGVFE